LVLRFEQRQSKNRFMVKRYCTELIIKKMVFT
jgi:hypothetical protein